MKLKQLVEEFKTGVKVKNFHSEPEEYVEVFVNPTPKELKAIGGGYRWLLDLKKKKVFAFTDKVMHASMFEPLGYNNNSGSRNIHFHDPNFLGGITNSDGKTTIDSIFISPVKTSVAVLKNDWSFAYKYIPGLKPWLEKNKKPALKELERRFKFENPEEAPLDIRGAE